MPIARATVTVLFEDPFWICLYERESEGRYEVCKITFGAEPRDVQVYEFLLTNFARLAFSPAVQGSDPAEKRVNPKRMQRVIQKRLTDSGVVGTKAQQALKLQQEAGKQARRTGATKRQEAEAERRFDLRQEKRREKHRGH